VQGVADEEEMRMSWAAGEAQGGRVRTCRVYVRCRECAESAERVFERRRGEREKRERSLEFDDGVEGTREKKAVLAAAGRRIGS
jgi:hypothetical protein